MDNIKKYYFKKTVLLEANIEDLFRFHLDTNNVKKVNPFYINIKSLKISDNPLKKDSEINIVISVLGFEVNWELYVEECIHNKLILDTQRKGMFKYWKHYHLFEQKGTMVLMTDRIEFLPYGGAIFYPFFYFQLYLMFSDRHKKMKRIFNKK
ncbi:MAG: hypothetical protein M0P71_06740 [Melioribacteraceae bacterium]|nr:hypothetical protein [Melioribacteraceae bacterium]